MKINEVKELADRLEDLLPQTQCTKCGYPDCRGYAEALARGVAVGFFWGRTEIIKKEKIK